METPQTFECNVCLSRYNYFSELTAHKIKVHKVPLRILTTTMKTTSKTPEKCNNKVSFKLNQQSINQQHSSPKMIQNIKRNTLSNKKSTTENLICCFDCSGSTEKRNYDGDNRNDYYRYSNRSSRNEDNDNYSNKNNLYCNKIYNIPTPPIDICITDVNGFTSKNLSVTDLTENNLKQDYDPNTVNYDITCVGDNETSWENNDQGCCNGNGGNDNCNADIGVESIDCGSRDNGCGSSDCAGDNGGSSADSCADNGGSSADCCADNGGGTADCTTD